MKQLPADTVRLLSSSQVITSVVNVLKELLENSLDAGASSVDVKLENYGLDRIEVRDNGQGVKAADAPVMAVRHFTSKICSHDDLLRLETYGFRGEALGSICAVAEVAITTKTPEEDISIQYMVNHKGEIVSQKPSHLGQGTTVSVLKLFKNLPVRRQYYSNSKKCKEELKKIQDLLVAYAVIKPDLRLTLVHNKVVVWQKSKVADHRSALAATLGPAAVANLLPCHYHQEQPEIFLEGFFPKPGADYSSTSSSSPDKTLIFVNNRPVHHKDIMKLLRQHYTAQYPGQPVQSRYPTLMLKVTVPPSSLDVNLTPDKTQILLHNKEAVLTAVEALLVSLYGYQPGDDSAPSPAPPLQTEGSQRVIDSSPKDASHHGDPAVIAEASNGSSSSSVADDWFVNQTPVGLESDFSLYDDETTAADTSSANKPPQRPECPSSVGREQVSAEAWSRGTALADPSTSEPLQPVQIHQASRGNPSDHLQKSRNSIAEKRDALTAYDLICNRVVRAPPPEEEEEEAEESSAAGPERGKNLGEEERKKYEEKTKNQLEHHEGHGTRASASVQGPGAPRSHGLKRKAPPLSNQQLLDQLFSSQHHRKGRSPEARAQRPLPCSVAALGPRLQRLSAQRSRSGEAPRGLRVVNRLASQNAWVILCGQRLMLLNPFRVEEALLFKRLLENNILPAERLQNPIQLTDGILGGAEYTDALCDMEKQRPELNGRIPLSDARLVANGFQITLTPGQPSLAPRHLEVTAVAGCVPFLGVDDLREILSAVVHRKASAVRECRPLKVTNYLQGEAVRLARQLPTNVSRDEVEETLERMEQQLHQNTTCCIHGRPFLRHLWDVPSTEREARAQLCETNIK